MNLLKAGAILLSVWSGSNLLVGIGVTAAILLGQTAPIVGMVFESSQIPALDPRLLAVVNAQAALANPLIAALCALVLAIVWTSLIHGMRWSLWSLAGSLLPLQAFGFVSDAYFDHHNVVANVVSSAVLLGGLGLSAAGMQQA